MSIHSGEKKTRKGPTKGMGGEEALGQIGEKKPKIKILRKRKKRLSRRKRPTGSLHQLLLRPHYCPVFFLAVGLPHSLSWTITSITEYSKDFQLLFQVCFSDSSAAMLLEAHL